MPNVVSKGKGDADPKGDDMARGSKGEKMIQQTSWEEGAENAIVSDSSESLLKNEAGEITNQEKVHVEGEKQSDPDGNKVGNEMNAIEKMQMTDEALAEKLQMDEVLNLEKTIDTDNDVNISVEDDVNVEMDKICDVVQFVSEEQGGEGINSGEEGGKLQITDSEEYIDSQESVDFATRVGIVIPAKEIDQEEEERRRCSRLKTKEDKTALELATLRKEARNAFVGKALWQKKMGALRKKLKGWNLNWEGVYRKTKADIMQKIDDLDVKCEKYVKVDLVRIMEDFYQEVEGKGKKTGAGGAAHRTSGKGDLR
ncbi:hypothetical protein GUJ93_ZPchr0002g26631 [Zizania palustris]|uniref:Uncharacterized protein n=1 Tax=Zizania palustris TaxID=103762 RepID=A0A8J5S5E6_ZIZPA|nr:hypothetical protein GUJ93_ZPchr0002g26631 [Zizania palustris]